METAKPSEIIDRIIRRKQNGETKVAKKNTVSDGQGRWNGEEEESLELDGTTESQHQTKVK